MNRRIIGAGVAGALLLALPACGNKTDESSRAAGITPTDALAFVSVNLDPSIAQKRNLLSIARKFPAAGDTVKGEFDETKAALVDRLLEPVGLDFERDVKSWLGDEVAVAVLPPAGGDEPRAVGFVEATDEGDARAALDKARAQSQSEGAGEGVLEYRFIGDFAVIAQEPDAGGTKAVLDAVAAEQKADDGGLAKSARFAQAVDRLAGDRLLLGWVDVQGFVAAAAGAEELEGFDLPAQLAQADTAAFDLHVESSAVVLRGVAREGKAGGASGRPQLTASLPADTIAALTIFDLARAGRDAIGALGGMAMGDVTSAVRDATGLDLEADLLSWMGGEAVLVAGAVPPGQGFPDFGLVVEATDEQKAGAALTKLRDALAANGVDVEDRQVAGAPAVVVPSPIGPGVQPAAALFGDRFVLANRPEYLEALAKPASPGFGESDSYKRVVGSASRDDTSFQLVVRIDPIREAFEAAGVTQGDPSYEQDARPNLEPLDSFGARAYSKDGWTHGEMKVTFD